jgi:hypothetical protein
MMLVSNGYDERVTVAVLYLPPAPLARTRRLPCHARQTGACVLKYCDLCVGVGRGVGGGGGLCF